MAHLQSPGVARTVTVRSNWLAGILLAPPGAEGLEPRGDTQLLTGAGARGVAWPWSLQHPWPVVSVARLPGAPTEKGRRPKPGSQCHQTERCTVKGTEAGSGGRGGPGGLSPPGEETGKEGARRHCSEGLLVRKKTTQWKRRRVFLKGRKAKKGYFGKE